MMIEDGEEEVNRYMRFENNNYFTYIKKFKIHADFR